MNVFWSYFLPIAVAGLVIGVVASTIGFRRGPFKLAAGLGVLASVAAALIWHGPLGASDRFVSSVERSARETLVDYEMSGIAAHLHRDPLSRQLVLSGTADDFQRSELARILSSIPGVRNADWSDRIGGLPLAGEAAVAALLGFLAGALLGYLAELHRRHNAQWSW